MMKLVMVDPSKSRTDKVRSNTFHHFKNEFPPSASGVTNTASNVKNHNLLRRKESNTVNMDNADRGKREMSIVFHKFSQENNLFNDEAIDNEDNTSLISNANNYGNTNINEQKRDTVETNSYMELIDGLSVHQNKQNNSFEILNDETITATPLDIRVDPKYNTSNSELMISSKKLLNFSNMNSGSTNINSTSHHMSQNKIKKITFIKGMPTTHSSSSSSSSSSSLANSLMPFINNNNNSINSEKQSFSNTKMLKQYDRNNVLLEEPILNLESFDDSKDLSSLLKQERYISSIIGSNDNSEVTGKKEETGTDISMVSNNSTTRKESSKKDNTFEKARLRKIQRNHSALNGYSTYTFKVNLKDK